MFGLQTVPASRAALIVALNPAVTFIGAALLFGDRPSPAQAGGVALALAGAPVAIALQAPVERIPLIVASLALGTAAFVSVGLIGAALTASVKRGGVLLALIVLPLMGRFYGADALKVIERHTLGKASVTGTYSLNPRLAGA
jgi:drug/metabolite transporter (DMT)-like permease